ncbi:NAD(P)/FAD-dependent oxidoreductase [Hydrogenophaga sp. BPS33]|uniref:NAD(P)/FAD-dependent oxidoreductase n=1 Tax=Hydrogenophaga sp. BPS33 TaxID=2651974 RepID=UPI00131F615C|nr:NAD(P)/FAD-dependent oxidoreductase [Hydrogenophaga sp. BPS33]QHE86306.1 NAD(P)/FAD-dependent oxidoreductase [Hydrogenophaga sp. BPS33]
MTLANTPDGLIETDAVIVGAGPVGLFQVFELGLLEIKAHVIDALTVPGGQPSELYPDKPIYDIPAIPVCTGQELVDRLLAQIKPFGATFHLGQEVSTVQAQDDGRFFVATSTGTSFLTKTIFIAAGVGAFQPRPLNVDGLERFKDTQLFYSVKDPSRFGDQHVVVIGGGDSALDWSLNLAADGPHRAKSLTLIHRRDGFQAAPASVARMRDLCEQHRMRFMVGQVTGFEEEAGRLATLNVTNPDDETHTVPVDMLLVFFGLSPRLGPIAEWGLDIERRQLRVDTEKFSTNVPGIFAVGDINTYPGKKKLILSGFHECALAAFGAAPIIFPDKKVMLQYTTTSPKLHKALGVASPILD